MIEDAEPVTKCPNCGARIDEQDYVTRSGGIEVYRCGSCGTEGGATVSVHTGLERLSGDVEVYVRWQRERPTAVEIAALRAVHAQSAARSVKEIVLEATGPEFPLGMLERGEAMDLQATAKERGLNILLR